jgi:hypothetical protein
MYSDVIPSTALLLSACRLMQQHGQSLQQPAFSINDLIPNSGPRHQLLLMLML